MSGDKQLSSQSQRTVRKMTGRLTSGIGGMIGFFTVWIGLTKVYTDHWLSGPQVAIIGIAGALVGGIAWELCFSRPWRR
ncbi:hypothetical protein [Mitsuaria sp. 7]|uniref:hypothetical protein n=1 Tax=Mitsuaria sp. 7 TaxID=1658665 RepID=UPI0012FCD919|nr:hypothetical protein [Mitsuaria sp. 7]